MGDGDRFGYVVASMCGRFTLKSPGRVRFDWLNRSGLSPLFPRYNIAPSQDVLTIRQLEGDPEASFLQWGLIPSWSNESKGVINARSETLEEKPSFRESFLRRRCLIPADGFYEWLRSGKIAQPYFFQLNDSGPFAFAGIWDERQREGTSIISCAIITTKANELLASIHDRMPVMLDDSSFDLWLNEDARPSDLKELLTPYPADQMTSHAVSYDVNHPKIDEEYLVNPVEPNIGVTLKLF